MVVKRKKKGKGKGLDRRAMAVLTVAVAVVLWVLVKGVFFAPPPVAYDDHGCEAGNIGGHTIIIFDRTDPLEPSKHRAVISIVDKIVGDMVTGDKLSIFEIDSSNMKGLSAPRFDMCRPRDGKNADRFTENPKLLSMKFAKTFSDPLQVVLEGYQGGDGQPRSPIIECLMDVVHVPDFGKEVPRRSLYIFSDMLQHTSLYSHYNSKPEFKAFRTVSLLRQMVPHLAGVEVHIYYLLRSDPAVLRRQNNDHVRFWLDFFSASDAVVEHVEKVR